MAEGSDVILALKAQAGLGTPASGGSGIGIEVRPSQGLRRQVATIESQMLKRNKMRNRARPGSIQVSAAYETELQVGNLDEVFKGVLGASAVTTVADITNAEVTSVTISGTGTLATTASGSLITLGVRSGMMGRFTGLSVSGNNGKWFPILDPTASTFAIPSGILADNATDSGFTLEIADSYTTPTTYTKTYYTVEEYLGSELDFSKRGTDMRFNSLTFQSQPDAPTVVGFGLGGRNMDKQTGVAAPVLTSPVFGGNGESLIPLDGGVYIDGVLNANLTGFNYGLTAPINFQKMLSSRFSPDVYLGMFGFSGTWSGVIVDDSMFDLADDETPVDIIVNYAEPGADPLTTDFVSVYIGNAILAAWDTPIPDGPLLENMVVYAGDDRRGTGYNQTTFLISTYLTP